MLDLEYEVKSWDSSDNETVVCIYMYVSDPSSDPVLQSGWVHEDSWASRATTNSERRLDRPVQVTSQGCVSQNHHKPIGINNLYNLSRLMLLWWEGHSVTKDWNTLLIVLIINVYMWLSGASSVHQTLMAGIGSGTERWPRKWNVFI